MDEYLHYLNTLKSYQHGRHTSYDSKRMNYSGNKYQKDRGNDRFDRDLSRKRGRTKEFRDLDNPGETNTGTSQNVGGRQLISYDDL